MKKINLFYLLLMLALIVNATGCSQQPEAERSAAKAAMDSAMAAGADRYTTTEFVEAKRIWDEAEGQLQAKKYTEAKKGFIDAKAAFEKLGGGIEAGKQAFAGKAAAAVADIETGWNNLEAMAKKYENKLEKKKLWEGDTKTFLEGLKSAKEMVSTDPAKAIEKAGQLKAFLDSYTTIFRQLATAPTKYPAAEGRKARSHQD